MITDKHLAHTPNLLSIRNKQKNKRKMETNRVYNLPGSRMRDLNINRQELAPMDQSGQHPNQYSSPSLSYESASPVQQVGGSERSSYNGQQHAEGLEKTDIQPLQDEDRTQALERLVWKFKSELEAERTEKEYYQSKANEYYAALCDRDPRLIAERQRRAQAPELATAVNTASSPFAVHSPDAVSHVSPLTSSTSSPAVLFVSAPSALHSSAHASAMPPPPIVSSSDSRQIAGPSATSSSAPRQSAVPSVAFLPDPREQAVPSATRSSAPRHTAVQSVTTLPNPGQAAGPSATRQFAPYQRAECSETCAPASSPTALPAVARLSAPLGPAFPIAAPPAPPILIDLTIDKSSSCSPSRSQKRKRAPEQESDDEGFNERRRILSKSFDWMRPKDRPNFQKKNPYQADSTGNDTEYHQYDYDVGQADQKSPMTQRRARAPPPASAQLSDSVENTHSHHLTRKSKTNYEKRQETAKSRRQAEARKRLKIKKKQINNVASGEKTQGQEAEDYEAMADKMEAELEKETEDAVKQEQEAKDYEAMADEMEAELEKESEYADTQRQKAEDYEALGEEMEADLEKELEVEYLDEIAQEIENWFDESSST